MVGDSDDDRDGGHGDDRGSGQGTEDHHGL